MRALILTMTLVATTESVLAQGEQQALLSALRSYDPPNRPVTGCLPPSATPSKQAPVDVSLAYWLGNPECVGTGGSRATPRALVQLAAELPASLPDALHQLPLDLEAIVTLRELRERKASSWPGAWLGAIDAYLAKEPGPVLTAKQQNDIGALRSLASSGDPRTRLAAIDILLNLGHSDDSWAKFALSMKPELSGLDTVTATRLVRVLLLAKSTLEQTLADVLRNGGSVARDAVANLAAVESQVVPALHRLIEQRSDVAILAVHTLTLVESGAQLTLLDLEHWCLQEDLPNPEESLPRLLEALRPSPTVSEFLLKLLRRAEFPRADEWSWGGPSAHVHATLRTVARLGSTSAAPAIRELIGRHGVSVDAALAATLMEMGAVEASVLRARLKALFAEFSEEPEPISGWSWALAYALRLDSSAWPSSWRGIGKPSIGFDRPRLDSKVLLAACEEHASDQGFDQFLRFVSESTGDRAACFGLLADLTDPALSPWRVVQALQHYAWFAQLDVAPTPPNSSTAEVVQALLLQRQDRVEGLLQTGSTSQAQLLFLAAAHTRANLLTTDSWKRWRELNELRFYLQAIDTPSARAALIELGHTRVGRGASESPKIARLLQLVTEATNPTHVYAFVQYRELPQWERDTVVVLTEAGGTVSLQDGRGHVLWDRSLHSAEANRALQNLASRRIEDLPRQHEGLAYSSSGTAELVCVQPGGVAYRVTLAANPSALSGSTWHRLSLVLQSLLAREERTAELPR